MTAGADITILNLNVFCLRFPRAEDRARHLPLGPLYVAAALERSGFVVDFRDYQDHGSRRLFAAGEVARFLADPAPVIGFSCMTNLLPFTLLAMRDAKRAWPDRTLVLAGVGPLGVEREILERFPWVDVVLRGEAETSAPVLLEALRRGGDLSSVPGAAFRRDGAVVLNPKPPRIENLDALPRPAYRHVDLSRLDGFGMITTRGCPYACRFCSVATMWDRRAYRRSVHDVVDEMRFLHETADARLFLFQDDLFVTSKSRVMSFCETLERSGLRVQWKALGRVDLVDEELMRTMARAGCIDLRFGIESGSDGVLRGLGKGLRSARTIEVVRQACAIVPKVDLFYVWGMPFETLDDLRETAFQMIAFRELGANIVPLLFCRLPQSELGARRGDARGLELAPDLVPESLSSGVEVYRGAHAVVPDEQRYVFDLIAAHPDVFPGWYVERPDETVRPKLAILQELGFYPPPFDAAEAA